jgi:hypothetical protein
MKIHSAIAVIALLAAGCKTRNENSSLVITSVVPPVASSAGTGAAATLGCKFDPATPEYTPYLPYNPAENRGVVAAVVSNNLVNQTATNPLARTDTTTFLPHQVVVTYEYIPAAAGTPPPQAIIPTSGIEVLGNGKGTVGIDMFSGANVSVPAGTYIRVTFHIEGKLLDGSLVNTSEREYLFRFCNTAGCGLGGIWSAQVGTATLSCM